MGLRLAEYFSRMDRESIALGEARMQLKLGMSRKRAAEVEDRQDLIEKAEKILAELIQTKDLFKTPRRS
jgi:hypothetical protein